MTKNKLSKKKRIKLINEMFGIAKGAGPFERDHVDREFPDMSDKLSSKMPIFVIHEHAAKKLHWDLRLQMDNVLKSWAVPKEPPKEKGLKRLAIQVNDHAIEYAKFHGKIPEGQYGAGVVKIWDSGKYELIGRKPNKIVFSLRGKKLKGEYVLVKFASVKEKNAWLLFRK